MVAGTSVGSIIAAAVACGVPAPAIVEFFTKDAPEIFKSSFLGKLEALTGPKYGAGPLEAALMAMLGHKTLADCKIRLVVTFYDFATDRIGRFDSGAMSSEDANEIVIGKDSPVEL